MERAEQSLLFLTAAGVVCQIGDREWYGLCVLTLAVLASGVQAEEKNGPPCLREKRAASQENYYLEAYDCNKPESTIVYHTPQQCPKMKEWASTSTLSKATRQNYTIIQEGTTFDYPAILCIVHRARAYYDCVWKSHVRVAAPAKIYQWGTRPVDECAITDFAGFF